MDNPASRRAIAVNMLNLLIESEIQGLKSAPGSGGGFSERESVHMESLKRWDKSMLHTQHQSGRHGSREAPCSFWTCSRVMNAEIETIWGPQAGSGRGTGVSRRRSRLSGAAALAVLSGGLLVGATGCASTNAPTATAQRSSTGSASADRHRPSVIYITDFYLPPALIEASPGPASGVAPVHRVRDRFRHLTGEDPSAKAGKLVAVLGESIAARLNQAGYRAEYRPSAHGLRCDFFPADVELPRDGWLLGGWFDEVREGNRAAGATVGFGAGSGEVLVEVVVSDLAGDPRKPFLCIGSENAKQRMPGGLVMMNPYAMAAKFVLSRGQTEREVRAMGAAIADCLIRYLEEESPATTRP